MSPTEKKMQMMAKCANCGKTFEVSPMHQHEAKIDGCLLSPCCYFVATVQKVKVSGVST
jgi:ssDNA-binding Zn-finger/Zn-ribbon topoisomerase 1